MKKLLAGPFIGEFGWELFLWQGAIRKLAENYDEIIISSRPGHEYLYKDFYTKFVPFDPKSYDCDCMLCWKAHGIEDFFLKYNGNCDILFLGKSVPSSHSQKYIESLEHKYIKYGEKSKNKAYDIVIHARDFKIGNSYKTERNGNIDYSKIVNHFKNLKIASIGLSGLSKLIPGTDNKMDLNLHELANILTNSNVIIGPSSGPIHYASLCDCSQVVWTIPQNRHRFEKTWNPFSVKSKVIDEHGWSPPEEKIIENVERMLSD